MDSDNKLGGLSGKLGKGIFDSLAADSKDQGRQNQAVMTIFLALLAILVVVGTEPFKVLLRKNIGKFALGIGCIIVAGLVYISIGVLLIKADLGFRASNKDIFLAGGFFYIILGAGVLICGIKEYFKGRQDFYRGDSTVFGFLIEKGTRQERIWTVYEPLSCILIGGILYLLHPFIGLPILITAISFLFNELYNVRRRSVIEQDKIARLRVISNQMQHYSSTTRDDEYSRVHN